MMSSPWGGQEGEEERELHQYLLQIVLIIMILLMLHLLPEAVVVWLFTLLCLQIVVPLVWWQRFGIVIYHHTTNSQFLSARDKELRFTSPRWTKEKVSCSKSSSPPTSCLLESLRFTVLSARGRTEIAVCGLWSARFQTPASQHLTRSRILPSTSLQFSAPATE